MYQVVISYCKNNKGYRYRYQGTDIADRYLLCQIEALARFNIKPIIATNWDFVGNTVKVDISSDVSAFATKFEMLNWLIENGYVTEDCCYKDNDAWQLEEHSFPENVNDIGYVRHSMQTRNKPQCGIAYIRRSAFDLVAEFVNEIKSKKVKKEESYIPYKMKQYPDRFTWLGYEMNCFRQGEFNAKYPLMNLPIINLHMKPEYDCCFARFMGKNKHNVRVIPKWLEELWYKYELRSRV